VGEPQLEAPGAAAASKGSDGRPPPAAADIPVLYKRPRALDADLDGRAGFKTIAGFAFAQAAGSVPLTIDEYAQAQAHYPIVFTTSEPAMSVAVLGLAPSENLFVAADGSWRRGAYVPAYVRRYPFIFQLRPSPEGDQLVLCIDEASGAYLAEGGEAFFRAGRPSALTERALQFCATYQARYEETRQFVDALAERALLVENRADLALPSGRRTSLGGFRVVDEKRFGELPDELFIAWRRRGWLALIYVHLLSLMRLGTLADLMATEART